MNWRMISAALAAFSLSMGMAMGRLVQARFGFATKQPSNQDHD
jgi:hypothetical protein